MITPIQIILKMKTPLFVMNMVNQLLPKSNIEKKL